MRFELASLRGIAAMALLSGIWNANAADWTRPDGWVAHPLPDTHCLYEGSAGKLPVLHRDADVSSTEIVIYVEGGGSCYTVGGPLDGDCYAAPPAHPDGYTQGNFENERKLSNYVYLSVGDQANPFRDMNKAMIPYCTGDLHSGKNTYVKDGVSLHFNGDANFKSALNYLLNVKYPAVNKVWLLGTSAGGAGAAIQYDYVRSVVQGRGSDPWKVYLIEDSSPGIPEPAVDAEKFANWGSTLPCLPADAPCDRLQKTRLYNRSLSPGFRQAFMTFSWDEITSNSLTPAEFKAKIFNYMNAVEAINPSKYMHFFADNTLFPGYLECKRNHVVTTSDGLPSLKAKHVAFVQAMVSGTGWASQSYEMTDCATRGD